MKRALLLVLLLALLLPGCSSPGSGDACPADLFQAFGADFMTFGAACYKPTSPSDEGAEGTGVKGAFADLCAPAAGDDPCVACEKASCCDTGSACVSDATCLCLVGCQAGATLSTCEGAAQCDASPNATYAAAAACSAKHCASSCRRLATP